MSAYSHPISGVSISSIPASCPYARAMAEQHEQGGSNDSDAPAVVAIPLPPAVAEEWKQCPAFSAFNIKGKDSNHNNQDLNDAREFDGDESNSASLSCPFKGAKSPEELSKTLSQIPLSHFGTAAPPKLGVNTGESRSRPGGGGK